MKSWTNHVSFFFVHSFILTACELWKNHSSSFFFFLTIMIRLCIPYCCFFFSIHRKQNWKTICFAFFCWLNHNIHFCQTKKKVLSLSSSLCLLGFWMHQSYRILVLFLHFSTYYIDKNLCIVCMDIILSFISEWWWSSSKERERKREKARITEYSLWYYYSKAHAYHTYLSYTIHLFFQQINQ